MEREKLKTCFSPLMVFVSFTFSILLYTAMYTHNQITINCTISVSSYIFQLIWLVHQKDFCNSFPLFASLYWDHTPRYYKIILTDRFPPLSETSKMLSKGTKKTPGFYFLNWKEHTTVTNCVFFIFFGDDNPTYILKPLLVIIYISDKAGSVVHKISSIISTFVSLDNIMFIETEHCHYKTKFYSGS